MGDRMRGGRVEPTTAQEISEDENRFSTNRTPGTLLIQRGDLYATLRVKFNVPNIIRTNAFKLPKDGTTQMGRGCIPIQIYAIRDHR